MVFIIRSGRVRYYRQEREHLYRFQGLLLAVLPLALALLTGAALGARRVTVAGLRLGFDCAGSCRARSVLARGVAVPAVVAAAVGLRVLVLALLALGLPEGEMSDRATMTPSPLMPNAGA